MKKEIDREISPDEIISRRKGFKLSSTQIIALGFAAIILIGALILCLPISSKDRVWTPFLNALFTTTSATCVTGLIVYDTFTHWSILGQIVIITLIQIGGIGFMTIITMFALFMKRQIGLSERLLITQAAGSLKLSGVVVLIKRILLGTLLFEGLGAVILSFRFIPQMGWGEGIYNAIFHSISAFCNAGFDIMGKFGEFSSLTTYIHDPVVSLTIAFLIIIGGIGFFVWDDIVRHKFKFKQYSLHSKIVLTATTFLLVGGTLLFYIFEVSNLLKDLSFTERIVAAFFQSASPRTAGFNTIDLASMSDSSSFLTIILMFIGGSSGSTAGGIKTTTLAVLLLATAASALSRRHIRIFKRRIDDSLVREAASFFTVYITATVVATLFICALEPFGFKEILFEVVSAIGTVGLTLGITPSLAISSKIVIMLLMFIGRVGWLTLVISVTGKQYDPPTERVAEKILIG